MIQETNQTNSYLTFRLANQTFATNVNKVMNILEMIPITRVPKAPAQLKGVINLRGMVLPVIDARIRMGMQSEEYSKNTCILVMKINSDFDEILVGTIVDAVHEVIEVNQGIIMPPQTVGAKYKTKFTQGIIPFKEKFIMLLDIDSMLSVQQQMIAE